MRASSSRFICRALATLAVATVLPGCAGQVPQPTDAHVAVAAAQWPGTTRATLAQGRRLYVDRCSGCHSLVVPGAQPAASWPSAVDEMADRARLSPREADVVVRYLVAVAEAARSGAGAPR
jgi:mono/diheme cytochrome c family protein